MPDESLHRESERIAALLDEAQAMAGPLTWQRIDELIQRVVGLYGAGIASLVDIAKKTSRNAAVLEDTIEADELVSSLLIVHGVHPLSTRRRVERAIADVCARAGESAMDIDVEVVDIDPGDVVTLRLSNGTPSSRNAMADAIKRAIDARAPEVARVDIEGTAPAPKLYQITRREA